ncbi:alpha/beta fold hydrolase [Amycolatopsis carbonis]|uniref:alpha/beta fold hydrolase n=1 Tax=Amycolatopsis carbonis TaxID=715471 RepID=UPI0033409788
MELARESFTVVAPDFSGSGSTVDHGGPVSIADLAAEALAAADDAGLTTFHVAGHSLGAVVAAHLAGTHPARVRSAVLHAAWPKTDPRQDAEFRYWLALLDHGTDVFARNAAADGVRARLLGHDHPGGQRGPGGAAGDPARDGAADRGRPRRRPPAGAGLDHGADAGAVQRVRPVDRGGAATGTAGRDPVREPHRAAGRARRAR